MNQYGRIYLYSSNGELLQSGIYHSLGLRKMTIQRWTKVYQGQGCYYQIDLRFPYTRTNTKEVIDDAPKQKIIRPPAIYSNKKYLYEELNAVANHQI